MSLDSIIRKIHLYTGLQACISLLMFSIIVLTFSTENDEVAMVSQQKFVGDTNLEKLKLATVLFDQIGNRFEAKPKMWMVKEKKPDMLLLKLKSAKGRRKVYLNKMTGDIEIRSWPSTFSQFLNHMHQESFARRQRSDSLWLWAWSFYLELSMIALFVLPITGLYIWVSGSSLKKYWANLSLASSLVSMVVLWNLIR